MIAVTQAQALIAERAVPLPVESVSLEKVHGRILCEPIRSPEDLPPFDRSAMDGYAIHADEAGPEWEVSGEVRAGETIQGDLPAGRAWRIFTGARLPGPGLQVLMQEDVEAQGSRIRLLRRSSQSHVRLQGEDARAGEVLLAPGVRLDAAAMALLASIGQSSVLVARAPRILHVTTGDEIVPFTQTPGSGQIRNSNGPLIAALAREWGGFTERLHAADDLHQLIDKVGAASSEAFDLILISGGSGAGKYDFTGELLHTLGVKIEFREVDVRPGKPLIFGSRGAQLFFGLPGNVLSHFVCFHLFVRTALARLLGRSATPLVRAFMAETGTETAHSRETWWPGEIAFLHGKIEVRALPWKSSGDLTRLPGANALIKVPAHTVELSAGMQVDTLSLRSDA